jgi:hypothetical protein
VGLRGSRRDPQEHGTGAHVHLVRAAGSSRPSGKDYRIIKRAAAKQFLHYYFYIVDPGDGGGPMSLRVGSYLPFSLGCWMNGHSYLAQQLKRHGVRFRKEDNAILDCDDPQSPCSGSLIPSMSA